MIDDFEKAIRASSNLSSHEGTNHRVINHHIEFLDGSLYVVEFDSKEDKKLVNYVYIEGSDITVCKNPALLNELVARKSKKTGATLVLESIGGIAGIIGLIITLTIVWLLIKDPKAEVPQLLSAALTTILGFYFGTKTNK
jgi:hypothetical protein